MVRRSILIGQSLPCAPAAAAAAIRFATPATGGGSDRTGDDEHHRSSSEDGAEAAGTAWTDVGAVLDTLRGDPTPPVSQIGSALLDQVDPYGEDLQLALYCCYELHYRGFVGVADEWEWDPTLLGLRRQLEKIFLTALRSDVPGGSDVTAEVDALLVEVVDAEGISHYLCRAGKRWQLREYLVHRSLYHLKEADPQAWVIRRLDGPAKAALVTVEHDEYGSGHPHRMHAQLFATMMTELGLCAEYGTYLDAAPVPTLAEVNFMSLCDCTAGYAAR